MREIKFRAWNKVTGVMFSVGEYMPPASPAFTGSVSDDNLNAFPLTECDLMQYTGLKDKNGKEIYEGDILQGQWGLQQEEELQSIRGPIEFRGGCFVWRTWLKTFTEFDGKHPLHWVENFPSKKEYRQCAGIEVIGNIHENPDLLEAV